MGCASPESPAASSASSAANGCDVRQECFGLLIEIECPARQHRPGPPDLMLADWSEPSRVEQVPARQAEGGALRPDVDSETRALNDAAVRVLAGAVIAVRQRAAMG